MSARPTKAQLRELQQENEALKRANEMNQQTIAELQQAVRGLRAEIIRTTTSMNDLADYQRGDIEQLKALLRGNG